MTTGMGEKVFINALLSLARTHIRGMKDFYDEGESHFTSELKRLEERANSLTDDEWEQLEGLIDQRYELEVLRELKRNFSIVGLFTVFEMFLRRALLWLHWPSPALPKCIRKELRDEIKKKVAKKSFDEMKVTFKKIGVPIAEGTSDWQAIMGMKLVRNCIAHYGGRPDEEMAEKLEKDYKICMANADSPTRRMKLSKNYFRDSADLVERTCDRIIKKCHTARKENRVKAWRTVSGDQNMIKYIILIYDG